MAASGAKYGIMTSHFYWVGAIPAMVFVGIFMMPFYYGSKARSVPEYLKLRFDEKTRGFNAISFAVMTVVSSGVSMYGLAKLLNLLVGWEFDFSLLVSALIVLIYIFLGGLTSAIYNEVVQFFLIVLGFIPLVFLGLRDMNGWEGLKARLGDFAVREGFARGTWTEVWKPLASSGDNPMHVEWFGMLMGLGFVLAFGYWCTDFLVVQRAMAADSMVSARRTPLIAAVPKMLFPILVILPGMIALTAGSKSKDVASAASGPPGARTVLDEATVKYGQGIIPPKLKEPAYKYTFDEDEEFGADSPAPERVVEVEDENKYIDKNGKLWEIERDTNGKVVLDYDMATPRMLAYYLPVGLLGLGLTALMASFMSGMAGNVTAFNTVWTYDIYQSYIAPKKSDGHYLWMGRFATVFGIAISVGAAYITNQFNNIMDLLQLVFAFVNAPLFATFMLGMFWKRTTGHGAFFGLLSGTAAAAVHHGLTVSEGATSLLKGGWLRPVVSAVTGGEYNVVYKYGSEMALNFWTAIYAWTVCFLATIVISLLTRQQKSDDEMRGLVYSLTPHLAVGEENLRWYQKPVTLAIAVLTVTIILNIIFW
jgi:SSS family solute:Na+ symporter